MSNKQQQTNSAVFQRGQQAFREGNDKNPYPTESPYHTIWEQGYDSERDIHEK